MNFFTHIFQGFLLDFKLLFIALLLGIILWKGVSRFNGGICFSDGGASFLSGRGAPWGRGIGFDQNSCVPLLNILQKFIAKP